MFEIKIVPDIGARIVRRVARNDLAGVVADIVARVSDGLVVSFTVHTIFENEGE